MAFAAPLHCFSATGNVVQISSNWADIDTMLARPAIKKSLETTRDRTTLSGLESPRSMVVMFHYVHDQFEGARLLRPTGNGVRSLRIKDFETQLDQLSQRFEPTDWTHLASHLEGRWALPAESFLLTFDDGLREHAEVVAPILERRGLKGLFFVPGSILSGQIMLTAHGVHLLLERLGENQFESVLTEALSKSSHSVTLSERDEQQARLVYHYESPSMARLKYLINMRLPLEVRANLVQRLFESHVGSKEEWARRWYMNPDQVRALHARGHTIGGHSFAHEPYGRLDESTLASDANRCSDALNSILGPARRPFAYPFGSVHPAASRALETAGFSAAFGTKSQWLVHGAPRFELPRVDTIHVDALMENDSE